ncbi:MAG: hypothetical protein K6E90_10225, partial [Lachnospiraceae bacterium]|nr:hypothetical protein [Lachnospiraceae bacterium]
MRARRLSKPGRILVYIMSFLLAFSSTSTFCIQAIYAAVQTVDIRGEETLKGMLNVGSIVESTWEQDPGLLSLLNERDLLAVDYTRNNNILGTYTKSGELTGAPDNWLSNVMYEGSVLRSNTFAGFNCIYGEESDAFVIKEGINSIDVTLVPVSDTDILDNGGETEIRTWERQSDFASRFMLPHMSGPESDI